MEEKKTVSVEEVLNIVVHDLSMIHVPVMEADTLGMTIKNSVNNLLACIEAIRRDAAPAQGDGQPQLIIEEITGDPAKEEEDDGNLDAE